MTAFSKDEVVRVLEAAADRIETHGWTKRALGEVSGPNCMAGAIKYAFLAHHPDVNEFAVFMQFVAQAALQATEKLIGQEQPAARRNAVGESMGQIIATWNDWYCPSAAAAADMLRHAAKYYAEENNER